VASESSFYRVLHAQASQVQRRGRARPPQEARLGAQRGSADGPKSALELGHHLPAHQQCAAYGSTSIWWSTSGAARSSPGTSTSVEDAQLAADLMQQGLRQGAHRHRLWQQQRQQPRLILHADNGSAMRAATLEVTAGGAWGTAARFQGPGCRTTTPTPRRCSARPNTAPTTPAGPLPARKRPASGRAAFVDWYVHRAPPQRHPVRDARSSGTVEPGCCHLSASEPLVYEQARDRPTRGGGARSNPLLATTRRCLDQSTHRMTRTGRRWFTVPFRRPE
jgi:putative transposase